MLPEPVDVLRGHQISDEKEAIFLIEEPLIRGQQVIIQSIPAKLKIKNKNKKACLAFWANVTVVTTCYYTWRAEKWDTIEDQ